MRRFSTIRSVRDYLITFNQVMRQGGDVVGIISSSKVGVYVDAENLRLNGGFGMQ